jgi:hypothetical protein
MVLSKGWDQLGGLSLSRLFLRRKRRSAVERPASSSPSAALGRFTTAAGACDGGREGVAGGGAEDLVFVGKAIGFAAGPVSRLRLSNSAIVAVASVFRPIKRLAMARQSSCTRRAATSRGRRMASAIKNHSKAGRDPSRMGGSRSSSVAASASVPVRTRPPVRSAIHSKAAGSELKFKYSGE